jgi:hypothetical protein
MRKPGIKKEIIIKTDNTMLSRLVVHIGTQRALKHVAKESGRYCTSTFGLRDKGAQLPLEVALYVSPCYDILEVKEHLESLIPKLPPSRREPPVLTWDEMLKQNAGPIGAS